MQTTTNGSKPQHKEFRRPILEILDDLKKPVDKRFIGNEFAEVEHFGDAYSNAEAMAFRRACARFGLGLALWEK